MFLEIHVYRIQYLGSLYVFETCPNTKKLIFTGTFFAFTISNLRKLSLLLLTLFSIVSLLKTLTTHGGSSEFKVNLSNKGYRHLQREEHHRNSCIIERYWSGKQTFSLSYMQEMGQESQFFARFITNLVLCLFYKVSYCK